MAPSLGLKQHSKNINWKKKRRKEGEKEKEGRRAETMKCASQISCYQVHNWLMAPAAEFWIHHYVCTETIHPIAALSQRVSMAGVLRQPVPAKYRTPLFWTLALGLSIGLAKTFLELHYNLRLYLSNLSSSPLHRCHTCVMVEQLFQPPQAPSLFSSQFSP